LARAKRKYDFQVENFCILGNQFHLMVRPRNRTNLSALMQWILSVFAMAWNRIHRLSGHVWGDRFFSRVVDSFATFLRIFGLLDNLPFQTRQTNRPSAWVFSALGYRRRGRQGILDPTSPLIDVLFPNRRLPLLGPPRSC
jgi:putative transposase